MSQPLLPLLPPQCDGAEVRLDDRGATLFYYIHKLCQQKSKSEPLKRAWDLTYSLVYQEGQDGAEELPQVGVWAVTGRVWLDSEWYWWGCDGEGRGWEESDTAYAALLHDSLVLIVRVQ